MNECNRIEILSAAGLQMIYCVDVKKIYAECVPEREQQQQEEKI